MYAAQELLEVSDADAVVGFNISKPWASKKSVVGREGLWVRKKLKQKWKI